MSAPCPHSHPLPADRNGPTRAVFLDRDGVLIKDTGYPSDPEAIELLPDVGEALRALHASGWRLVVISNQAGVAKAKFPPERLAEMHERLIELVRDEGVLLDGIYYCPHHPEGHVEPFNVPCDHRKPAPGMLLAAARELGLELANCWMVGDKESDIGAAHAAGCRAVRVGKASATAAEGSAPDLMGAARFILHESGT